MRKSQLGASYISILFVVICFIVVVKFLVAISGPYFDDRMINKEISSVLKNTTKDISVDNLNKQMNQRFSMNNIKNVQFKDIAKVTKDDRLFVRKKYEVRRPFLFNIDLVLKFEKNFDQSSVQTK